MRVLKALATGLFASAVIVGGFWVSGFDFDSRGSMAFGCYAISVVFFGFFFAMVMNLSATK
jgi:hypothetical protein